MMRALTGALPDFGGVGVLASGSLQLGGARGVRPSHERSIAEAYGGASMCVGAIRRAKWRAKRQARVRPARFATCGIL